MTTTDTCGPLAIRRESWQKYTRWLETQRGGDIIIKWLGIAALLAACAAVLVTLSDLDRLRPGVMPACDAKIARETVSAAVEGSPYGKARSLKVFEVADIVGDQIVDGKRQCRATLLTNAGREARTFTIEFRGKDRDSIWIETALAP